MRTLFLHIQKTGGTSVFVHLKNALRPRTMLRHAQFAEVPAAQLSEYEFIAGHFGFDHIRDIMDSSYSFTFLRDPVQRVLSLYSYCHAASVDGERTAHFPIFESARCMSVDEFVRCEDPASGIPVSIDNTQTWQLARHYDERARARSPLSDQALLELALANLAQFSHVGFQEALLCHLRCILLDLGFSAPRGTCTLNKSESPLRADALRPQTLDSLRDRLRLDLALYEHARVEYALR